MVKTTCSRECHQPLPCPLRVLYETVSGKGHSCVTWPMILACIYTFSFAGVPCPQETSCLPCAVNICPSTVSLLLGDRLLLLTFLSEVCYFCSFILKTCKRNMASLPRMWIIRFQLNLDRKSVKCVNRSLVREKLRIQRVLKAREQQCSSERKPAGKRNITEGSVKGKPGEVAEPSEHPRLTTGLRINEPAELSSVSSSNASCFMHCLLCSPAHHPSSPIDAESFCKSILNPGREHFVGNVLGHSASEATKAKFHSPEVWWFPDGTLGSSQPNQKSREMAGIWQDEYLT